jgi:serine protease AprX
MAASHSIPEQQAKVKPFDPISLDRTVIAIPLLQEMKEDLDQLAAIEPQGKRPRGKYNTWIEFNPNYPGGPIAARDLAITLADAAKVVATQIAEERLANASNESHELLRGRLEATLEAAARQVIGPLQKDTRVAPASLHAGVIRRLLVLSERCGPPGKIHQQPILRVFPRRFELIIDLNLEYPGGRDAARQWVAEHIDRAKELAGVQDAGQQIHFEKDRSGSQYIFARLEARVIQRLVALDLEAAKSLAEQLASKREAAAREIKDLAAPVVAPKPIDPAKCRAIFHIWPDFEVSACVNRSIATVKADAAQNSFSAFGSGITWAVLDTGIDAKHPHFRKHSNIDPTSTWHKDFTIDGGGACTDPNGHGTHVAGIIAGEWRVPPDAPATTPRPVAVSRYLKEHTQDVECQEIHLDGIGGMAPRCKLISLRTLDENGKGSVSNLIAAIDHIQEINGQGRRLLIHGVNMSLGYNFEPEWFACGQSPLCVEVNRLVKTGVVVVVAAGNTGYGTLRSAMTGPTSAGMALTINDPGNADLAITVGSTHRDMPHVYGVSYFSSKGPTGDGRLKPDLVAPGEKIISCATGNMKLEGAKGMPCDYVETSGTSMAAPHVSGVIAAFLSVRGEFIGKADRVKEIFLSTATDLRRDPYFQGAGLVDLMRAIQSV